jgi:1,2-diacylglycerol 3-alpha-glucosyltransferase
MLSDVYKPYISGITHHIEVNKRHLEAQGHEVFVFTFGEVDFQDDEPNVIRTPGLPLVDTGYYLSFRYSRAARKLVQTMDIVHVHHPFLSGRLALRYCQPLRIPIVFTNHTRYDLYAQTYFSMLPEEVSDRLLHAYMPSFCEAVDLVISPSAGMAKILREMGVENIVAVIPNGVELQRFIKAQPRPRAEFGFKSDDILLIFAGRVAAEKNLTFLLRAFAGVSQTIPNTQLMIIGGGSKQYEAEILQLVSELKISGRVRLTGMVPYDELPSYLAMGDAFVTASVTEVHPLSVIEAMGAGLPVVGIHSPGVSDTILDGITGFLATEDLPAFTAKLTYLCLDHDLRRKMGAAARRASSEYAIEDTVQTLQNQYQRLIHGSRPRRHRWDTRLRGILQRFLE